MYHNTCFLYACSYEMQKNNADVSYNIELSGPYNRLHPLVAGGKYCNEKLTWRKTQWQVTAVGLEPTTT